LLQFVTCSHCYSITARLSSVKHDDHNNEHKQQQLLLAAGKNQFNMEGVHHQQDDYSNSHYTDDKALNIKELFVGEEADHGRCGLKKSKTTKKTKDQKSEGGSSKKAKSTKNKVPSLSPTESPTAANNIVIIDVVNKGAIIQPN
jgi:hypothetical protein